MDRKATLQEYAEEHIQRRRMVARNPASVTFDQEATSLKRLWTWWDAKRMAPEALTPELFDDFLRGPDGLRKRIRVRKNAGPLVEATSYNKMTGHITPFIEWLIRLKVVDAELLFLLNGARVKGAKSRTDQFVRLNIDQLTNMINTAGDEFERFVLSLAAYSGGRESELLNRQLGHVGADGRIAWFRQKTQQGDRIPVMPELNDALGRWLEFYRSHCRDEYPDLPEGEWWLVPRRGVTTSKQDGMTWWYNPQFACGPQTVARIVKKHVARILDVDPDGELMGQASHIMRRSAAYCLYLSLLEAGIPDPMRVVMALLGHKKTETTANYIGVNLDRQRRDEVLMDGTRWMTPEEEKPAKPEGGIVIPFRSRRVESASG